MLEEEKPDVIDYQAKQAVNRIGAQYVVFNCVSVVFGVASILIPVLIGKKVIREDGLVIIVWFMTTFGAFICSIAAFAIFIHEFVFFSRRDRAIWFTLAAGMVAATPIALLIFAIVSALI